MSEIEGMIGLIIFFPFSDLTFVASEFKSLFLQYKDIFQNSKR